MVSVRVGQTLYSAIDSTTVVVVRAPQQDVSITCGDADMITTRPDGPATAVPAARAGTQIGKRYTTREVDIELLCTKAGAGTLAVDGTPLEIQQAKPLPASD